MDQKFYYHLKNLVKDLEANQGYFIIECGGYYCQLAKDKQNSPVRFEAVSHFFNKNVEMGLETAFKDLGFNLSENENYSKDILITSGADIEVITQEIVAVMENIYQCNNTAEYEFNEEIEHVS